MKISVYSDIHSEFDTIPYIPPYNPDVDVMVLAGDCFVAGQGYEWLHMLMEEHKDTPNVIFIPGNHDYYGCGLIVDFNQSMFAIEQKYENFYYLNMDCINIGGINFHGASLWTSFDSYGPVVESELMSTAKSCLADFTHIPGMTPGEMRSMARNHQKFFSDVLFNTKGQRNICISHFPPLIECVNENFEANVMSPYFNNDISDIIKNTDCELWIYGHNHYNAPFDLYDTRFISNQRGYAAMGESGRMGHKFDEHFVIEV